MKSCKRSQTRRTSKSSEVKSELLILYFSENYLRVTVQVITNKKGICMSDLLLY